jgi:hypothetical protein
MEVGKLEKYTTQDQEPIDDELEKYLRWIETETGQDRKVLFSLGLVRIVPQELISSHSLEPRGTDSLLTLIYYGETPAALILQTRNERNFTVVQSVALGIHRPHEL